MLVSEITTDIIKVYCRIDADEDDNLITAMLAAAKVSAESYTGLTETELDSYPDMCLAILALIADMYDVRAYTMNGIQINPVARQIFASHCKNFV